MHACMYVPYINMHHKVQIEIKYVYRTFKSYFQKKCLSALVALISKEYIYVSLIVNKKNTKEIIVVTRVNICDKTHVDFQKTLILIFSACTTSKFFRKQTDKMGIK